VVGDLVDAAGQRLGLVAAHRDVTDRVRAEEAARQSEAKFRTAFHQAGFGIVLVARDGRILDHNRAIQDLLGYGEAELAALRVQDLNQEADVERSGRFLAELFSGTLDGFSDERRYRRKDGTLVEVQLRVSPVPAPDGGVACALGIVEDVSARRQLERKLLTTERMASMGMLAAGVAHEINNPLSFVLANLGFAVEAIRTGTGSPGEVLRALEEALEGASRVRTIVRDVKTFSREHAEDAGTCQVAQVLQSAANVAQNELRLRARLVLDAGDVPPVAGSAHRVGQVLLNLLLNAAQAIPPGRAAENEVRVTATLDGPMVAIEVRDTGTGIAPEVQDRLFQPFATTKAAGQGTGLGLFISRELVVGMGGRIDVQSRPGAGTSFVVRLPRAPAVAAAAPPAAKAAPTPPAGRRASVLVVDDEPLVARALRRFLASRHDVTVEASGTAALARADAGEQFDVIFCDLMMPGMTGMELHAALRERHPDQAGRVVFMTGGAFTSEARQFLEQVPNRKVEKPFEQEAMLALVDAASRAPGSRSPGRLEPGPGAEA
jgi:PAS domain S-box-containing protein